jgi:hypothetical protein
MTGSADKPPADSRPFGERRPFSLLAVYIGLLLLLLAGIALAGHLLAAQSGPGASDWRAFPWRQVGHALEIGAIALGLVVIAVVIVGIVVGVIFFIRDFKRARVDSADNLRELAELNPNATMVAGFAPRGFHRNLRRLRLGPADRAWVIAAMTDATSLTLWALDTPYHRFVSIPAPAVVALEYRRPSRRANHLILTAVIRDPARTGELGLLVVPLAPQHSTAAGRALMLDVLTDNLRNGTRTELPDGFRGFLATEAEVAALRTAGAEEGA